MTGQASLSDLLAAERTFLAWIRTGLALSGFGFVIARFGLFLRAMGIERASELAGSASSPWFGGALILCGSLTLGWSAWSYTRLIRRLRSGSVEAPYGPSFAAAIAIALALLGLALAAHLFAVEQTASPQEKPMSSNNGIVTIPSHHSVDETVQRLEETLAAKGVKLFALVDHSGEADKAGFAMRPTKLLIFGSPKAGTPVMLAAPSAALDLPLKVLVWEKADGTAWISYNSSSYLQGRHGVPENLVAPLAVVDELAAKVAE